MDKIIMIKHVKDLTGCGLREAKEMVEEFQAAGDNASPTIKELMAKVATMTADRPPRSKEYRQSIFNTILGIRYELDDVEHLLGDDCSEARQILRKIPDQIDRLDRFTFKLEEALNDEYK